MRREIKKLHQQLKTTVVYVTHDQTEAMSLGTNIAIMNHGVIQQMIRQKIFTTSLAIHLWQILLVHHQ